jgi:hypothetical protein
MGIHYFHQHFAVRVDPVVVRYLAHLNLVVMVDMVVVEVEPLEDHQQ